MIARRIQIFGKVQGVFFRASAKTEADNRKLSGWVKNEANGTVIIEVQGLDPNVQSFLKWCREGPQFSNVSSVSVEEIEEIQTDGFEVRH